MHVMYLRPILFRVIYRVHATRDFNSSAIDSSAIALRREEAPAVGERAAQSANFPRPTAAAIRCEFFTIVFRDFLCLGSLDPRLASSCTNALFSESVHNDDTFFVPSKVIKYVEYIKLPFNVYTM